jgi:hypothetical protein
MNHPDYNNLIHEDDVSFYDILMGRGGHTSHRKFHQQFLDMKDVLRQAYQEAKSNAEKRVIQQMLVDFVHTHRGRFLRRVNASNFIEISLKEALKKASNALREDRIRHKIAKLDEFELFHGFPEDIMDV